MNNTSLESFSDFSTIAVRALMGEHQALEDLPEAAERALTDARTIGKLGEWLQRVSAWTEAIDKAHPFPYRRAGE